jgi:hypothetical protein
MERRGEILVLREDHGIRSDSMPDDLSVRPSRQPDLRDMLGNTSSRLDPASKSDR